MKENDVRNSIRNETITVCNNLQSLQIQATRDNVVILADCMVRLERILSWVGTEPDEGPGKIIGGNAHEGAGKIGIYAEDPEEKEGNPHV